MIYIPDSYIGIIALFLANIFQAKVICRVTNDLVFETVQSNTVLFDKNGEFHYDITSALIKSIRGSDPNKQNLLNLKLHFLIFYIYDIL